MNSHNREYDYINRSDSYSRKVMDNNSYYVIDSSETMTL